MLTTLPRKISLFASVWALVLFCSSVEAADLHVSGPNAVCPDQSYTYTASATGTFGARNGDFSWSVWRNGVLIPELTWGVIYCPNGSRQSTSTATFNFGKILGPVRIKVQFLGSNNPICSQTETVWFDVNVRVPSMGTISGLTFCSPGETRTLTIPGIPWQTADACNFHHAYEWTVPAGWKIRASGSTLPPVTGGIRAGTSVEVTAPTGVTLSPGYQGNYTISVRTEDAWPYPQSTSGKVWVGAPYINATLNGGLIAFTPNVNDVCNSKNYSVGITLQGSRTGTWTRTAANPTNTTWSASGNNLSSYFWAVGQTATFRFSTTNVCGTTARSFSFRSISCTSDPNNPCATSSEVSPNPARGSVHIMIPAPCATSVTTSQPEARNQQNVFVALINSTGRTVRTFQPADLQFDLDVSEVPSGLYYLKIRRGKSVETHRVVIED
jgi:hypothetical protein